MRSLKNRAVTWMVVVLLAGGCVSLPDRYRTISKGSMQETSKRNTKIGIVIPVEVHRSDWIEPSRPVVREGKVVREDTWSIYSGGEVAAISKSEAGTYIQGFVVDEVHRENYFSFRKLADLFPDMDNIKPVYIANNFNLSTVEQGYPYKGNLERESVHVRIWGIRANEGKIEWEKNGRLEEVQETYPSGYDYLIRAKKEYVAKPWSLGSYYTLIAILSCFALPGVLESHAVYTLELLDQHGSVSRTYRNEVFDRDLYWLPFIVTFGAFESKFDPQKVDRTMLYDLLEKMVEDH